MAGPLDVIPGEPVRFCAFKFMHGRFFLRLLFRDNAWASANAKI